ncbi:MAG: carboxypeptidase-like regulatory domain-containing protein [Ignavibacteria bacterium]|nr:carboxypeptidase-like regulatory domain-containing protein [Ignavibacteria bacterium]
MTKLKIIIPSIIIAIIGIIFFSCDDIKQADYRAILQGYVRDSSNDKPIEAAQVYLSPENYLAFTDSNGFFRMTDIHLPTSAAYFNLTVMKSGYITKSMQILLTSLQLNNIVIYLRPEEN